MKAVIIAAGMGSRIKKLTDNFPKCMLDLCGKKIIDRIIEPLINTKIIDISIIVGFQKKKIIDYVSKKYPSVNFIYNSEWNTKANGYSVYTAKDFVGSDEFLLLMSDHIYQSDIITKLLDLKISSKEACLVIDKKLNQIFDIDDATKVLIDDKKILKIHKQLTKYNAVDCGIFKCNNYLFNCLEASMADKDESLSGGINKIIETGKMRYCDIENYYWQDIDHYDGYMYAQNIINKNI